MRYLFLALIATVVLNYRIKPVDNDRQAITNSFDTTIKHRNQGLGE